MLLVFSMDFCFRFFIGDTSCENGCSGGWWKIKPMPSHPNAKKWIRGN